MYTLILKLYIIAVFIGIENLGRLIEVGFEILNIVIGINKIFLDVIVKCNTDYNSRNCAYKKKCQQNVQCPLYNLLYNGPGNLAALFKRSLNLCLFYTGC